MDLKPSGNGTSPSHITESTGRAGGVASVLNFGVSDAVAKIHLCPAYDTLFYPYIQWHTLNQLIGAKGPAKSLMMTDLCLKTWMMSLSCTLVNDDGLQSYECYFCFIILIFSLSSV